MTGSAPVDSLFFRHYSYGVTQALDPALALLILTFAHDQRLMEPILRISQADLGGKVLLDEEPQCDVLQVLASMLSSSWAHEEVGTAQAGKGLSKLDVRALSSLY